MTPNQAQAVVDRLFEKFALRWARLFLNEYEGLDVDKVKKEWAGDLERFDMEQARHAFEACKFSQYPPSLPMFVQHCKACPKPEVEKLERKLTDEEMQRNRAKLKGMLEMLTKGKLVPEDQT